MRNKDIISYNAKCQRHGYWEYYYDNGQLHYKCVYLNGQRIGFEERYSSGKLSTKIYHL